MFAAWCYGGFLIVAERTIFTVRPLPYSYKSLEPYLSRTTLEFHYDKHYRNYVETLNEMLRTIDRLDEATSLEEVMMDSYIWNKPLFNAASQAWNHDFYFKCMTSHYLAPPASLVERISQDFGSFERFTVNFRKAGNAAFGSGWAWLILDSSTGELFVTKTAGADNPMILNQKYRPILIMDVWEHAYYLDFQNRRKDYTETFVTSLVDWRFVADNLAKEEEKIVPELEKLRQAKLEAADAAHSESLEPEKRGAAEASAESEKGLQSGEADAGTIFTGNKAAEEDGEEFSTSDEAGTDGVMPAGENNISSASSQSAAQSATVDQEKLADKTITENIVLGQEKTHNETTGEENDEDEANAKELTSVHCQEQVEPVTEGEVEAQTLDERRLDNEISIDTEMSEEEIVLSEEEVLDDEAAEGGGSFKAAMLEEEETDHAGAQAESPDEKSVDEATAKQETTESEIEGEDEALQAKDLEDPSIAEVAKAEEEGAGGETCTETSNEDILNGTNVEVETKNDEHVRNLEEENIEDSLPSEYEKLEEGAVGAEVGTEPLNEEILEDVANVTKVEMHREKDVDDAKVEIYAKEVIEDEGNIEETDIEHDEVVAEVEPGAETSEEEANESRASAEEARSGPEVDNDSSSNETSTEIGGDESSSTQNKTLKQTTDSTITWISQWIWTWGTNWLTSLLRKQVEDNSNSDGKSHHVETVGTEVGTGRPDEVSIEKEDPASTLEQKTIQAVDEDENPDDGKIDNGTEIDVSTEDLVTGQAADEIPYVDSTEDVANANAETMDEEVATVESNSTTPEELTAEDEASAEVAIPKEETDNVDEISEEGSRDDENSTEAEVPLHGQIDDSVDDVEISESATHEDEETTSPMGERVEIDAKAEPENPGEEVIEDEDSRDAAIYEQETVETQVTGSVVAETRKEGREYTSEQQEASTEDESTLGTESVPEESKSASTWMWSSLKRLLYK